MNNIEKLETKCEALKKLIKGEFKTGSSLRYEEAKETGGYDAILARIKKNIDELTSTEQELLREIQRMEYEEKQEEARQRAEEERKESKKQSLKKAGLGNKPKKIKF